MSIHAGYRRVKKRGQNCTFLLRLHKTKIDLSNSPANYSRRVIFCRQVSERASVGLKKWTILRHTSVAINKHKKMMKEYNTLYTYMLKLKYKLELIDQNKSWKDIHDVDWTPLDNLKKYTYFRPISKFCNVHFSVFEKKVA